MSAQRRHGKLISRKVAIEKELAKAPAGCKRRNLLRAELKQVEAEARAAKLEFLAEVAARHALADEAKEKADEVLRLAHHVAGLLSLKMRRRFWRRIGDSCETERLKLLPRAAPSPPPHDCV